MRLTKSCSLNLLDLNASGEVQMRRGVGCKRLCALSLTAKRPKFRVWWDANDTRSINILAWILNPFGPEFDTTIKCAKEHSIQIHEHLLNTEFGEQIILDWGTPVAVGQNRAFSGDGNLTVVTTPILLKGESASASLPSEIKKIS